MSDLIVANTIRDQIGREALFMLGAQHLVGDRNSLSFKVRGSRKANHIKIILDASDTYSMEFYKIRGTSVKLVTSMNWIYADQLRSVIESVTGLYVTWASPVEIKSL